MSAAQTIQVLSAATALIASGGIATLTFFDVPVLKSQPASRSLPMIRWLFSRGSHVFPTAAAASTAGFLYLTYTSLPSSAFSSVSTFASAAIRGQPGLYLLAAALSISIAPWTTLVMVPTNFALIEKNEELGGSRSTKSARYRQQEGEKSGEKSAEESVEGEGDVSQWRDLSGPMEKTEKESSKEMDEVVDGLLEKFGKLNLARAVMIGAGGVVGLVAGLA
ncbi:hypothetical protein PTNB73_06220 [Pyrenophora teres f. teres]|uniref:DUF1772 domain containing protein n=1 Tax=Pyrenophora teres f. teres TaxID=97479 RepID=A0A6S6W975_9PLEO|nr:hypothetical protein PTNB85_07839 [Pyrenophora teres f. teres]KAE8829810.1 hypothetical protein HRS9139_06434 [Pyrenophora teres f. teres]KAE8841849.1 hypothetical protein HRS9122_05975 [Pyrenophora teres f. teres]KAE8859951.1 hypothetical protein PTNB29_07182 [Pyrenophora teres f. teres]KAE8865332.1 hypothetical protein PTNB73_06220 [Pyrenophora teres f. teres]